MLTIYVPMSEVYDESEEVFIVDLFKLELEHSLAALSKWESKFAKAFLVPDERTTEEALFYIEAMALDPNVPPEVFQKLTQKNMNEVNDYLESKQSATWFSDSKIQPKSKEIITAEIIYYWMTSLQIPWEAQYWHLNRLFTLIKVFDLKNTKPKPMTKSEQLARQRDLNAQRKKDLGTSG